MNMTVERLLGEVQRLRAENDALRSELLWYKKIWLKMDRLAQTSTDLGEFVKALFTEKEK